MTRTDLLARASDLGLSFGAKATKTEIESAISVREMEIAAQAPAVDADAIKAAKRKVPSTRERDAETNKVIRSGRNLSGNVPYRGKNYFVDPIVYAATAAAREAAPNQVKIILATMIKHNITTVSDALRGNAIVDKAKADGMATKIDSDKLFAYYRRLMENLGLVWVGNVKTSVGEDEVEIDEDEADAA